jgi:hypothetical protein
VGIFRPPVETRTRAPLASRLPADRNRKLRDRRQRQRQTWRWQALKDRMPFVAQSDSQKGSVSLELGSPAEQRSFGAFTDRLTCWLSTMAADRLALHHSSAGRSPTRVRHPIGYAGRLDANRLRRTLRCQSATPHASMRALPGCSNYRRWTAKPERRYRGNAARSHRALHRPSPLARSPVSLGSADEHHR